MERFPQGAKKKTGMEERLCLTASICHQRGVLLANMWWHLWENRCEEWFEWPSCTQPKLFNAWTVRGFCRRRKRKSLGRRHHAPAASRLPREPNAGRFWLCDGPWWMNVFSKDVGLHHLKKNLFLDMSAFSLRFFRQRQPDMCCASPSPLRCHLWRSKPTAAWMRAQRVPGVRAVSSDLVTRRRRRPFLRLRCDLESKGVDVVQSASN